jgi:hypothetical protein
MKKIIILLLVLFIQSCSDTDPYSEGMHLTYSISCEDGFMYKTLDHKRGTIPLLNSDGTRVKCGQKRY